SRNSLGAGFVFAFGGGSFGLLGTQARGRGDGGDGQIFLMRVIDRAGRQLDGGDVDRGAHVEAGQVDLDGFRDVLDGNGEVEVVVHDVEHAAALDARGCLFIDEVHRHLDVQLGVLVD